MSNGIVLSADVMLNDDFDYPIIVYTASYSTTQNVSTATTAEDDPDVPCAGVRPDAQLYYTIWYQFTPLSDGELIVDTFGSTGLDTVLAIWTGERGSLTSVGCNDDYNFPTNVQSRVQIPITEGELYYIEIAGNSLASVGTWTLNLNANVGIVSPNPIMPNGTIDGVSRPSFEWSVYAGATSYRLGVYSYTAAAYQILDVVPLSYCNATQCAYPAPINLSNGDYKFKVLAYTPSGTTPYSDWMNFTLTGVTIAPLTPLSPSGTIDGVMQPDFTWSIYPDATSYYLAVYSNSAAAYLILDTVATSYCNSTECSYPSPVNLANGTYKWKVLANLAVGRTSFSPFVNFSITGVTLPVPPYPPTPLSPSGTVTTTHRPTFTWSQVPNAVFYRLGVLHIATNTYTILLNVYPSCTGGVCSYSHPTIDLANGDYRFKVLARNATGMTSYSSWMNFSVNSPLPVAPVLVAPSGTTSTNQPTFQWKPVSGATKYRLAVYSLGTSSYSILTYVYPGACSSTLCSYTPPTTLASDDYKFKMLTYNAYGASGYSDWMMFTVP